ncbi:hypothetical protein BHM03_00035025, partial [Ensete ventricosum]
TFRRVIGRSTWAPVGRVSYATSKTPPLLSSSHGGGEAKPKHLSLLGVGGLSIYNWEPKLDDPLSSSHGGGEGKKDGAGGGGELDGRRGPPHRERARRRGRRWRRLEDGRRTARARQDPVPGAILAPCVSVGGVPKTAVLERVKILFQVPFSLLVRLLEASLRRPYWSATRSCSRCDSRALCVRFVVPSVAIGFTVYDAMKSWLRVPSRDEAAVITVLTTENKSNHPSSSLHS